MIDDIDGDGKPVVVAIHGGHTMDRKPVNLIKSIYGIESVKEWVSKQIKGGCNFRIYDIKKPPLCSRLKATWPKWEHKAMASGIE